MVLKEHQSLGDGTQPVAPQDGQAADVGQFTSLESGNGYLYLPPECFSECEKCHVSPEARVQLDKLCEPLAVLECPGASEKDIWTGFLP